MKTHQQDIQEDNRRSAASHYSQVTADRKPTGSIADNRPEAVSQMRLQAVAEESPKKLKVAQMRSTADNFSAIRQPTGQERESRIEPLADLPPRLSRGYDHAQKQCKAPVSLNDKTAGDCVQRRSDRDETADTTIASVDRQNVVQTVAEDAPDHRTEDESSDGLFTRIWKGFKKNGTWMMLIAEAIGHWTLAVLQAGISAAGAVWNFISAGCQAVIGGCKMVRAAMVRKVALDPALKLHPYFNRIVALEGALGVVSAITSGLGAIKEIPAKVVTYIPYISNGIGSLLKFIRGAFMGAASKRVKGAVIVFESLFGIFGNIERAINNAGKVFESVAKIAAFAAGKVVGVVKAVRGTKTFVEGAKSTAETAGSPEERQRYIESWLASEDISDETRTQLELERARYRQLGEEAVAEHARRGLPRHD